MIEQDGKATTSGKEQVSVKMPICYGKLLLVMPATLYLFHGPLLNKKQSLTPCQSKMRFQGDTRYLANHPAARDWLTKKSKD